jgi:hypothetical protein
MQPSRPRLEDTRSPGEKSLQSQMSRARELVPNIQPNPEPTTPKGHHMDDTNNHPNARLPETPGERSLREQMATAPDLRPVDPAAAERAYQTTGRRKDQVQGVRPAVVPADRVGAFTENVDLPAGMQRRQC